MQKERHYNTQRTCGVWLIYIGLIIIASALTGGEFFIQPAVLGIGFFIGYILIFAFPFVNRKLAYGQNTKFQDRMDNLSMLLNVILCTLCGLLIGFEHPRVVWLAILIAVGIHFIGFYFSQGKLMILLAVLTIINGALGLVLTTVPFLVFAVIDGSIKIIIGIRMLSLKYAMEESAETRLVD
ncbi:DUF6609 family protein [Planococcus beigongshangi]|uniref:DUF6609 family protein n=1 Tax=Planococcus beigongshangi TaxID=2782536 RepID=UPI00193BB425|nr:DUF6609 family protein [Planococcus beigongshangi]